MLCIIIVILCTFKLSHRMYNQLQRGVFLPIELAQWICFEPHIYKPYNVHVQQYQIIFKKDFCSITVFYFRISLSMKLFMEQGKMSAQTFHFQDFECQSFQKLSWRLPYSQMMNTFVNMYCNYLNIVEIQIFVNMYCNYLNIVEIQIFVNMYCKLS